MSTTGKSARATVTVELGKRSYPIHIGAQVLEDAGGLIAPLLKRPFTVIVTDENVAGLHLGALEASLSAAGISHKTIILKPGEATKSFDQLSSLTSQLLEAGVERTDAIIAFGGGVIGDLTGFAASILRRGVDFIQIPTTLLSQVDSSVGGKTGINTPQGKNLAGAFHQPKAVLADINVLSTLPRRQLLSGYGEVVKYGLINDMVFFEWLEVNWRDVLGGNASAMVHAVETSCRAKAAIVAEDELEAGARALLNLGHTFGHALEALTGYSGLLYHGEGVSIGMVLAFEYSSSLGLCPGQDTGRVKAHLDAAGLPVGMDDIKWEKRPDAQEVLKIMEQDKKVADGNLVLILANAIGDAFITQSASKTGLADFLNEKLGGS